MKNNALYIIFFSPEKREGIGSLLGPIAAKKFKATRSYNSK